MAARLALRQIGYFKPMQSEKEQFRRGVLLPEL